MALGLRFQFMRGYFLYRRNKVNRIRETPFFVETRGETYGSRQIRQDVHAAE
jgi:hypothetical protein